MTFLIDTHVFLRMADDDKLLSKKQRQAIARATIASPLLLSTISLWEIATLVSLGRIRRPRPMRNWLDLTLERYPEARLCEITTAVAQEVVDLGNRVHRDPADRIIVATARVYGATLITSDEAIVDAKVVRTLS